MMNMKKDSMEKLAAEVGRNIEAACADEEAFSVAIKQIDGGTYVIDCRTLKITVQYGFQPDDSVESFIDGMERVSQYVSTVAVTVSLGDEASGCDLNDKIDALIVDAHKVRRIMSKLDFSDVRVVIQHRTPEFVFLGPFAVRYFGDRARADMMFNRCDSVVYDLPTQMIDDIVNSDRDPSCLTYEVNESRTQIKFTKKK
jgi:hypothetical protein